MINTLAHIYRKPDVSRDDFRAHYETGHTALARRVLPQFTHYVRNHMIENTAPDEAPDVISEFGFDEDSKLTETAAILGDERGRVILDDELTFMNKPRNRIFVIERAPRPAVAAPYKFVLLLRGNAVDVPQWRAAWHVADNQLSNTLVCSETVAEQTPPLHWLFGWTARLLPVAELQLQLQQQGLPICWSARVSEHIGYPG